MRCRSCTVVSALVTAGLQCIPSKKRLGKMLLMPHEDRARSFPLSFHRGSDWLPNSLLLS
jgi:hypothetical protein